MENTPLAVLRGATVEKRRSLSRRTWWWLLQASLVALAVVNVVSVSNDGQREQRLRLHGLSVTVRVTNCVGNLGGSGSTGAGYHCTGRYTVEGASYAETVVGQSTFLAPGREIAGTVDPTNQHYVVATSALSSLTTSSIAYWPAALSVLSLVGCALLTRRRQRHS